MDRNIETNYYSHYIVNDFMKWIYKKLKSSDQIQSVVGIFLVIQSNVVIIHDAPDFRVSHRNNNSAVSLTSVMVFNSFFNHPYSFLKNNNNSNKKKTKTRRSHLSPATLFKKRLWRRCFPVNFVKSLRTPLLQSTSGRLLLKRKQSVTA